MRTEIVAWSGGVTCKPQYPNGRKTDYPGGVSGGHLCVRPLVKSKG